MTPTEKAIFQVLANIDQEEGNYALQVILGSLSESWSGHIFSRAELEQAAEHCLAMGWVKILSEQDCEEDRLRWLDDPHQLWSELTYEPGSVDFTSIGWNAYAKMSEEMHHRRLEDWYSENSGRQYIWRTPGRVSILSTFEEVLQGELAAICAGSDELVGGSLSAEHTLGEIIGPYQIGPWWVKRFYRAPSGYRVDISFEPGDMHFWA